LFVFGAAVACASARYDNTQGPGVTMPARLAEGTPQDAGTSEVPRAEGGVAQTPIPEPPNAPPDPEALKEPVQWEYVIEYDRGALRVVSVTRRDFKKPIPTARNMGRFAVELWIGRELIERVRFDFPLLGSDAIPARRRPLKEPPTFAAGATVQRKLLVPDSRRATRAVIVDRATGKSEVLPWPPDAPIPPHRPSKPRPDPDAGRGVDAESAADASG
jgi:hypothetical protein